MEKPDFLMMRRELIKLTDQIGGKVNFDEYQTQKEGFFKAVYTVKFTRKNGEITIVEPQVSN